MKSRAVIFGCAGPRLTAEERRFFGRVDPLGLIVFARNVEAPAQLSDLAAEFRDSVGRADAPVLVDQEGGRVQRLKPPHWRAAPAAARFGELASRNRAKAAEAARLNARLMGGELAAVDRGRGNPRHAHSALPPTRLPISSGSHLQHRQQA